MDDTHITTADQLDAALAAQRSERLAKLRRKATSRHFWLEAVVAGGVLINLWGYLLDRHPSAISNIFILIVVGVFGRVSVNKRRHEAALALAREEQMRNAQGSR
jgi:hypothetical protein